MLQHEVAMKILQVIEECTDVHEGYLQVIDAEHHHIHEGQEFQHDHLFAAVPADGYARLRVYNDDGKQLHIQFFADTEAKAYFKSYTGTTYSNDGTPVVPWNRSSYSTLVSVAKVYHTPTISVQGNLRINSMTGSGIGSGQIGGSGSGRVESILCTGCDFLIEVQNKSTTAKDIAISARWYEVPEGT